MTAGFWRNKLKFDGVLENKIEFGGVLDLTGGLGLKTRKVASCICLWRGVLHLKLSRVYMIDQNQLKSKSKEGVF